MTKFKLKGTKELIETAKLNTSIFKDLLENSTIDIPTYEILKSGLIRGKDMFKEEIEGSAVHIRFVNKSELIRFIKFIKPKATMIKIREHLEGSCGSFMTCPMKSVFPNKNVDEKFVALFLSYEDWDKEKENVADSFQPIKERKICEKDYKQIIENSVMVLGLAHLDLLVNYGQTYLDDCDSEEKRDGINEYTLAISNDYIENSIKEYLA